MIGHWFKRLDLLQSNKFCHIVFVFFSIIAGFAAFQEPVHAACMVPVTGTTMSHFLKNPDSLLVSQGTKNDNIVWRTRIFASASLTSLKAIEKIVHKANLAQKILLAEGLARAHSACSARDGEISHRIDDSVRKIADRDITRAYLKFLAGGDDKGLLPLSAQEKESSTRNSLGFDENVKLTRDLPSGGIKLK